MQKRTLAFLAIALAFGCPNAFGQTTSRVDTITYSDNLSTWVLGQVSQTTTNGVVVTQTTYDPVTSLPTATYNFGLLKAATTYNADGTVASVQDGNGNITSFKNYMRGIPQEVDFPATRDQPSGTSITAIVDSLGQIDSIVDAKGAKTCYSYDAMGRIATIQPPSDASTATGQCDGMTTGILYGPITWPQYGLPVGSWVRLSTTGSATSQTFYDGLWRPVVTETYDSSNTNATTSQVITRYDVDGNVTFTSYPQGVVSTAVSNTWGDPTQTPNATGTHSVYDALDRLTSETKDAEAGIQDITSYNYLSGFQTQVTDPNNNVITTSYLTYDEPTTDWPISIAAPAGVTQTITRDSFGSPTSITQSGSFNGAEMSLTKSYVYDANHRLCRFYEPETNSTVYSYDNDNNIVWQATGQNINGDTTVCGQDQVAADAQITRTYDAMNRVLSITPPDGIQSTAYTYNPVGTVKTATSGNAAESFTYTMNDSVSTEVLSILGSGYNWGIAYSYDANGHINAIGYPSAGGANEEVALSPDALGRATQVGSYANGITYFPNNQVASFNFGNGATYAAQQNTRQLMSNFSYGVNGVLNVSEAFTYDNNANITNVNDSINGPRTKAFSYDGLNRLMSASASALYGTESYTYDPLNNLRSRLVAGNALTFNYDGTNRLASVSEGASTVTLYGYDSQGNRNSLTNGGTSTLYNFDAQNQLIQIPGVEGYAYDAAGRRVAKTASNGTPTSYYFYNHAGQMMYSFDPNTFVGTNYIYLGSKLIAKHEVAVLTAPGAISFSSNPTAGNFTVSWGAVPNATSYTLQQYNFQTETWSTVYSGSAATAALTGVPAGNYLYQVQGCISVGCSAWTESAVLNVSPAIPSITVPAGVQNGPYTVSWTTSAGTEVGYTLQESFNGGAWNTVVSGTGGTSVNRPGTTTGSYTYQVEAVSSTGLTAGWSATSSAVTVNTNFGVTPTPAPSLSVPVTSTTGSTTLTWTSSSPVTTYVVQENGPNGVWTTVYSGTGTSVTLSGLTDATYQFQVEACNSAGGGSACTAWSAGNNSLLVELPPTTAPTLTVPIGVINTTTYGVSWTTVVRADVPATSYNLQQQVNGGAWTAIQSSSATSWSVSGENAGTYAYQVQACYKSACGPWSTTGTVTVAYPPTAAPTISGAGTSNGSFTLSWNSVPAATDYVLYYFITGTEFQQEQDSASTSWTGAVSAGGTYQYAVQACNAGGCGPFSSLVTETVISPPSGSPTISGAGTTTTGSFTLSWNTVATATSYNLYNVVGSTQSQVQASAATSWNGTLSANGAYQYAVKACNTSGCGPTSSQVTETVTFPPSAPTGVTTVAVAQSAKWTYVYAEWNAVAGATSYQVENRGTGQINYSGTATQYQIYEILYPGGTKELTFPAAVRACNVAGCSGWVTVPGT